MFASAKFVVLSATLVTLLALGLWVATGRDAYTKYEVVEEIQRPVDPNDPLAGTGFYENDMVKEVVRRPEFRLGLFPTPSGIFDKHILSVATLAAPFWAAAIVALFLQRRAKRDHGIPTNWTPTDDFSENSPLRQRSENSEACSACLKPQKEK